MKTSMWVVVVIAALFIGFLFGYAISVRTGIEAPAPAHAPAGGYGAPGYGAPAGGYGAPAGGYGAPAGGYGTPKPKTGGYGAPSGGYGR